MRLSQQPMVPDSEPSAVNCRLLTSLHHEAVGAADLDDAEAVVGADFLLHAVEVILHSLLGEAKTIGDFLVGEAFGDQWDELLFAAREAETLVNTGGREARGFVLDVAEQRRAERPGTNRFSRVDGLYGAHNVFGGSVTREVPANAGTNTLQEVGLVARRVDQKNEKIRGNRADPANGFQVLLQASFGGEKEDLRVIRRGSSGRCKPRVGEWIVVWKKILGRVWSCLWKQVRFAGGDFDIAVLREHAGQCFA